MTTTWQLATGNAHKAEEILAIVADFGVELRTPKEAGLALEVDEWATTFAANAVVKAVAYARAFAQVLGAGFHLRAAHSDPARLPLARFAISRLLPRHAAWLAEAQHGSKGLAELTAETLRA